MKSKQSERKIIVKMGSVMEASKAVAVKKRETKQQGKKVAKIFEILKIDRKLSSIELINDNEEEEEEEEEMMVLGEEF